MSYPITKNHETHTTFRSRIEIDTTCLEPRDLEDASKRDIDELVTNETEFFIWCKWFLDVLRERSNTLEHSDLRFIETIRVRVENTRLKSNQLNRCVLIDQSGKHVPISTMLWMVTCNCTAVLYMNNVLSMQTADALFSKGHHFLKMHNLLFHVDIPPSKWTLVHFVNQLESICNYWYNVAFDDRLVDYVSILETVCAYFVACAGNETEYNHPTWTFSSQSCIRTTHEFALYTDIIFRYLKRAIHNYMCIPSEKRVFVCAETTVNAGSKEGICRPFTPDRKAKFIGFIQSQIVPMFKNMYMMRSFRDMAMPYLFTVGLDEYKYYTNKLRKSFQSSIFEEFYNVSYYKQLDTFVREDMVKYYQVNTSDCLYFATKYEFLMEMLLVFAFNSFFIGIGLEWMDYFVVFETSFIVGQINNDNTLFGNGSDTTKQYEHKNNPNSDFRREYPVIVQRLNKFNVEYNGVVYMCNNVYSAIWAWSLFVHTRTGGVFNVNLDSYFDAIF